MSKRNIILVSILVAILILTACSANKNVESESNQVPRETIKIPFAPILGLAPLFIADEAGYFDEQNINVEWVTIASVAEAIPLLADGGLDVAVGTPAAGLLNAISRGMNLKVVAGLSQMGAPDECSFVTFETRKDLYESGEVTSIADWKGRKIGLNGIGALPQYELATLLNEEGLTLDDVELVVLPFPELVVGLQSKAIDVTVAVEPTLSQIKALDIGVTQIKANDYFPNMTSVFLMFGPNLLNDNPELGKRFMVAYLKAIRTSMEGKTESNVDFISNSTKLPKDVLNAACWDGRDPNAAFDLDAMMLIQKWFLDTGMIDQSVAEDQIYDSRFIDYAVDMLGEVK